jgi:small subunit ribosomal protein S10
MKFRILLRSFDNQLINLASQQLRSILLPTDCNISGVVALPTKIKRFCVLRSPHVDKDSREHFEVRLYKRFIDINTNSPSILDLLLKAELTAGVSS